jgi:hypothetical protein
MAKEFELSPTPLRSKYLVSQRLNDSKYLTYGKKVFSTHATAGKIPANASDSIIGLFSEDEMKVYGGVVFDPDAGDNIFSDGNGGLIFPAGFFEPGSILKTVIHGNCEKTSGVGAETVAFQSYGIMPRDFTALSSAVGLTLDSADAIRRYFRIEIFQSMASTSAGADRLNPNTVTWLIATDVVDATNTQNTVIQGFGGTTIAINEPSEFLLLHTAFSSATILTTISNIYLEIL